MLYTLKFTLQNLDYVILSGAQRQESRWDPTQNEQVVPETKETQKRLFDDSMFKLEHGTDDQNAAESSKPRLVSLFNRNESVWNDDYTANSKLRAIFRVSYYYSFNLVFKLIKYFLMFQKSNNEIKMVKTKDNALLKKSSLDIPLLPEREEDKKMASLLSMKLKPTVDIDKNTQLLRKQIVNTSSLPCSSFTPAKEKKALRILNSTNTKNLVKVKKPIESSVPSKEIKNNSESCIKKIKLSNSLVDDYGSSNSESD